VLCSPVAEVQLAALDCLAALVSGNETVGAALIATSYMGKSLVSQVREASGLIGYVLSSSQQTSVADPDPGSDAFLTPGSGMRGG
jgi:hypothetical protein